MKLSEVKGIGPKTEKIFYNNNILTAENLVEYYPYTFNEYKYGKLVEDEKITVLAVIESNPIINFFNKRLNRISFKANIDNKLVNVTIFNQPYLKNNIKIGNMITLTGKYTFKNNNFLVSEIKFGMLPPSGIIEPIYHSMGGISSKKIHNYILDCLNSIETISYVPDYLKEKYHLIDKDKALYEIHKPTNLANLKNAINYLKYEEMFLFMLKMNYLKNNKSKEIGIKRDINYDQVNNFINSLPFTLTEGQLDAIKDIYNDMTSSKKMNRLIQGDVGSGKTVVAIISLYINYLSNYQGVFMAPTEILAKQHYQNIKNYFKNLNINIELLTGKLKQSERKKILERLKNNEIDILIGTHALFSDDVNYYNLGLVITDEQHRFGVNQRGMLNRKGENPDILYLSATPIPRTYAIILYGDMDISSIKTMPHTNRKVETVLKTSKQIKDVLDTIYHELLNNHQTYIVAPLIEESEENDTNDINTLREKFLKAFGKIANIGILHGKMSPEEKENIMHDFKDNKINILISTTVIEVGVDNPNATTMVIFDAFRFGLSQLHQLRGRVGRNNLDNYCILISDKETERLDILTKTLDGFKISEEDFKMRGGGDIFGVRQSGQIGFNLADEKKDFNILLHANEDSAKFLNETNLKSAEYTHIWEILKKSLKIN